MNCPACGTQVALDARTCPSCGRELHPVSAAARRVAADTTKLAKDVASGAERLGRSLWDTTKVVAKDVAAGTKELAHEAHVKTHETTERLKRKGKKG